MIEKTTMHFHLMGLFFASGTARSEQETATTINKQVNRFR
jgi:hypothetical protein